MSINKEQIEKRKEQIRKDFDDLVKKIEEQEETIKRMRNNLNALSGASQQWDLFLKEIENDKDAPMPREKEQALNLATS